MWGPRLNLHQKGSRCNPAVTWGVKCYYCSSLLSLWVTATAFSNHRNVNPARISRHVPTQGMVSSGYQQFSCFPSRTHSFFTIALCILKSTNLCLVHTAKEAKSTSLCRLPSTTPHPHSCQLWTLILSTSLALGCSGVWSNVYSAHGGVKNIHFHVSRIKQEIHQKVGGLCPVWISKCPLFNCLTLGHWVLFF